MTKRSMSRSMTRPGRPSLPKAFSAALLLPVVLASCSLLPEKEHASSAAQACCETSAQFPFQDARLDHSVKADISTRSPSYAFPEGQSHFAAFRLPDPGLVRKLELKTYQDGIYTSRAPILCPSVTFLDEKKNPIASSADLPLSYQNSGLFSGYAWSAHLQVPPAASYAVVHAAAATIGRPVTITIDSTGAGDTSLKKSMYAVGGKEMETKTFSCGRTGTVALTLSIDPYQPAPYQPAGLPATAAPQTTPQTAAVMAPAVAAPTQLPAQMPANQSPTQSPNQAPSRTEALAQKLRILNGLYKDGIINKNDFEKKKQEILKEM